MSASVSLSRPRRLAAWLITGPIGHLYAATADWAAWLTRWLWAKARDRVRGS